MRHFEYEISDVEKNGRDFKLITGYEDMITKRTINMFLACLALLLSGSLSVSAQQKWSWRDVWSTDNGNDTLKTNGVSIAFTADCVSPWNYYNYGNCFGLNITGTASHTWERWDKISGTAPYLEERCVVSLDENNQQILYHWEIKNNGQTIEWQIETCKCIDKGGFMGYDTPGSYDNQTYSASLVFPDGKYLDDNIVFPEEDPEHYAKDKAHKNDDSITVTASGVFDHFLWGSPVWEHSFFIYEPVFYEHDSHSQEPHFIGIREHVEDIRTPVTAIVLKRTIVTKDTVRLTGVSGVLPFDTIAPQSSDAKAYLKNKATAFFFDSVWDGSFGRSSGAIIDSGWNLKTLGRDTTLGFNSGYTGGTADSVRVTGGILALGGKGISKEQHINILSTDSVRVDAYNMYAPKSCVLLTDSFVDYSITATNIGAKLLRITNTNWKCWAVNFWEAFEPAFSGNGGKLLIDPNVTNFQKGAKIVNTVNTTTPDTTTIESKQINVTGSFRYETALAPLNIYFKEKGNTLCSGCSYLFVRDSMEITNTGTGRILVTDSAPFGNRNAYVEIKGRYAYTGSDAGSDTVNVSGKIDVGGRTALTVEDDTVSFISRNRWIHFRDSFTFEGGGGELTLWANGTEAGKRSSLDSSSLCDATDGGFILFDSIARINADSGRTWIGSGYDDVVIGDSLVYASGMPAGHPSKSGEFVMQAGQDIYGKKRSSGISIMQHGDSSLLLEAQKTIHLSQSLLIDRESALSGDITLRAGYPLFAQPVNGKPSAKMEGLTWPSGDCVPANYDGRDKDKSTEGGDLWFENRVLIDLTKSAPVDGKIATTLRAWHSIFMDSTFIYAQDTTVANASRKHDNVLLFAETGNIEAAVTGGDDEDTVHFMFGHGFGKEFRIQAGNQVGDENAAPLGVNCMIKGATAGAEFYGNILFNKPFILDHKGTGKSIISAARDMETQVKAPFTFNYDNQNSSSLEVTAGRHVETHAKMQFNYLTAGNNFNITVQAGRLNGTTLSEAGALCKTAEQGSSLTQEIKVLTGEKNNLFSAGGSGNGSILLFDTLEFNYNGKGTILLSALNGNIESDPYLHGTAAGYSTHRSPILIRHGGEGATRLEATNIKLHDKIDYIADEHGNGRFSMFAFDSILTRNLKYTSRTDNGNVEIKTAKYRAGQNCNDNNGCGTAAVRQGHILLGYGAGNTNDSIIFDFHDNPSTTGANVLIRAGVEGFSNPLSRGYGGNITFDYAEFYMAKGGGNAGGYTEISTPNGNIWGKDSIVYSGRDGNLRIDAGLGSEDDLKAVLWSGVGCSNLNILNTQVPTECDGGEMWRTGNIMMKGAHLNFNGKTGNAIFRTREGFIDIYDAFTTEHMKGNLLVYAAMDDLTAGTGNRFGDVSVRDFSFTPAQNSGSGSVFFGADDNIMLNYGNSNGRYSAYGGKGQYDDTKVNISGNPYYSTSYMHSISGLSHSIYNVREDGYLFYKNSGYTGAASSAHKMYRGGTGASCVTKDNGARELEVDFTGIGSGGFAAVAGNYIDLFTKFTYTGGNGTGLGAVPEMSALHGENVAGFGLYLKSQYSGAGGKAPESRRATCGNCSEASSSAIEGSESVAEKRHEMTYIAFHDDATVCTQNQKSWIEAPVTEFFGHAKLDAQAGYGNITVKTDSLIFHDSVVIDGLFLSDVNFVPFTTDETQRNSDMRYGVINDRGTSLAHYQNSNKDIYGLEKAGPAISMEDRHMPVLELGYQRCTPPGHTAFPAPNSRSAAGLESTPAVGGDVVLAFKHGFKLPMFNSVVANNARISFLTEEYEVDYANAFIRTDLLRIRNKVEFYTPLEPEYRAGQLMLASLSQMDEELDDVGLFTRHLHTEPGSELSLPGEGSLTVIPETVLGGYGHVHEDVLVKNGGIIAPGRASLMEGDCASPHAQGRLSVHDLNMEQNSLVRISINWGGIAYDEVLGVPYSVMQTDILDVKDRFFASGKIPVLVMPETELIQPGRYLFMEYGDSQGVSREYVRNLTLMQQRYGEYYFSFDFSEPGRVYLVVTAPQPPAVERYIDLPLVDGVIYNYLTVNGEKAVHNPGRNYVRSHQDFKMNLSFTSSPMKVWAQGFYSHDNVDLDAKAVAEEDGSFTYVIRQVVEPWTISFGPQLSTVATGNAVTADGQQHVWAYRNTLYVNVPSDDIVSIYSVTGVLHRRLEIPSGLSKLTIDRGLYIVKLKDGKVYKITLK